MPYAFFHEYFPELASKETRTFTPLNNPQLPEVKYDLLEMYCDEDDCDCRRVFLSVLSEHHRDILAIIAYGWESTAFYKKWMKEDDPEVIKQLKGPELNLGSPQSKLAPALLQVVSQILEDQPYVERIKRHYQLFRARIAEAGRLKEEPARVKAKVGRNESCPCGSSKKYKKCCGE